MVHFGIFEEGTKGDCESLDTKEVVSVCWEFYFDVLVVVLFFLEFQTIVETKILKFFQGHFLTQEVEELF
jgi:hypothetical protein